MKYATWDGERWSEEKSWDSIHRYINATENYIPRDLSFGKDLICLLISDITFDGLFIMEKINAIIYDREFNKKYDIKLTSDKKDNSRFEIYNFYPIIFENENSFDVFCTEGGDSVNVIRYTISGEGEVKKMS